MIRRFFLQDKISVGITAILFSELLCAIVIWVVLTLLGMAPFANYNYWVLVFVPALLVMRYYMKQRNYLTTTKSAIVTLFVTFLAYMAYFIRLANINNVL